MRIGIDARFYGPVGKGLGRYTQKLIENLEKMDNTNRYFIFLRRENFDDYQPKNKNFHKILADYRWYTFAEQIKFPWVLIRYRLDLVHFPHFNVPILYFRKFIVTIHDLILINFPTVRSTTLSPLLYWMKFLVYKIVIRFAIYRSDKIIAVSKFTKSDILKNYPRVPDKKITVTYEACDDYCLFNPRQEKEILSRYGIIKPYLLYVGNAYPHKNPERLVLAFEKLKAGYPDLKLVFVGAKDYFYLRLENLVQERKTKNIIFSGFVPDYDLDAVFRGSVCYVRPSLYEGFELPPLEAMTRGIPVICSDHPCAREILGDSSLYFKREDVNDLTRVMKDILKNQELRETLIARGYAQVKKYSWKEMAKQTLNLYERGEIQ